MLSPSLVILSEAKNLHYSLRTGSAKNLHCVAQDKLREESYIIDFIIV
jgi:hypothetical protein